MSSPERETAGVRGLGVHVQRPDPGCDRGAADAGTVAVRPGQHHLVTERRRRVAALVHLGRAGSGRPLPARVCGA